MYFFSFDICVFLFVEQPDTLFCKAEIHLVFYLVNGDDAVGRDTSFDFKQEVFVQLFLWKAAYLLRFLEKAFLWCLSLQRCMGSVVVKMNLCKEISTKRIKRTEIPDIKGSHPLILHGAEPPLNLCFCSGCIGFTVV